MCCWGRGDEEMMREEAMVGMRRSGGCVSEVCCIGTGSSSVMWEVSESS